MNARTFLLTSLALSLLLGLTYVAVVYLLVLKDRPVPVAYSQFLLEAASDLEGKIVIESGSNGIFGIDTERLSAELGRPVLIVSDSAGYPLRKKYYRLARSLNRGDVLVLPLEWDYYSRPRALGTKFLQRVGNKHRTLEYYYSDLPLWEKLRFILTEYPLRYAVESAALERRPDIGNKWSLDKLARFEERFNHGGPEAFGGSDRDGPEDMGFSAAWAADCDSYLFYRDGQFRMAVSKTFRVNVDLFRQLQARGVQVYFTWPAVVDSNRSRCYTRPDVVARLDAYAEQVVETVETAGMHFLGEFRESHFPADCFLNTYYHLRYSCAAPRTDYLLALLRGAGLEQPPSAEGQAPLLRAMTSSLSTTKQVLE